jgi:putative ABC transport system permease protein
MWRNYLIIAMRSLAKNRLFTALNLIGLAVGMAACLLIAMWVRNEMTYDQWLPDHERIFVVQSDVKEPGQDAQRWGSSPAVMLPLLQQDFPQIESATRVLSWGMTLRRGTRLENQSVVFGDAGFFDLLKFPTLEGSIEGAFKAPNQMVVSRQFAQKWFGAESSQVNQATIGQTIEMVVKGEKRIYTIAAVLRDIPDNSMFKFDAVVPLVVGDFDNLPWLFGWESFNPQTIVKLKQASDVEALRVGAEAFVAKHHPPAVKGEATLYYRPMYMNIGQAHLQQPKVNAYFKAAGDRTLVKAIGATGVMILLIAIVTYINLATARVSLRAREVGLRKTMGATRLQLIIQFLVESTLLALLAGGVALTLVELLLPAFNVLLEQHLTLHYLGISGVLLPLLVLVLLVGLGGGWYPAMVLSRLRPREAMQGMMMTRGGGKLRLTLVVGQFAIAVLLINCMVIIYAQVMFLRKTDMGYQPAGMMLISQLERKEVRPQQQAFLDEVRRTPGVVSATRSIFGPGSRGNITQRVVFPDKVVGAGEGAETGTGARTTTTKAAPAASDLVNISAQLVDWDYVRTYGAKLLAGRDLSDTFANDDQTNLKRAELVNRTTNVLINRSMLKYFNTSDPQAVIGKVFQIAQEGTRSPMAVVGVVEDVRLASAREESPATYFSRSAEDFYSMSIRFRDVSPIDMSKRIEALWKKFFPDTPFTSKMVDEVMRGAYDVEIQRGNLFALFAGIAIVLCAAGLYGLAVFTAERRTKEIGIRKVLGASVTDIVKLLVWQFSKPVLIATLIAWPVAWWLMREWLNGFNVRIALTPIPFLAAGLLAMVIAWVTVTWHAMRVARMSPIHALRHE